MLKEEIASVVRNFGWVTDIDTAINEVISLIADAIERIDITEPLVTVTGFNDNYITGAKEEHAYIVEYLRGLLDN